MAAESWMLCRYLKQTCATKVELQERKVGQERTVIWHHSPWKWEVVLKLQGAETGDHIPIIFLTTFSPEWLAVDWLQSVSVMCSAIDIEGTKYRDKAETQRIKFIEEFMGKVEISADSQILQKSDGWMDGRQKTIRLFILNGFQKLKVLNIRH